MALPSLSARMNSMRALGNVVPLAAAWLSAVVARSIDLTISTGDMLTRAAVWPPEVEAVAERGCRRSCENDLISIQSRCLSSRDSPLMVSMLRNACCMIWFPFVPFFREIDAAALAASRDLPPPVRAAASLQLRGLRPLTLQRATTFWHRPAVRPPAAAKQTAHRAGNAAGRR